MPGILLSTFQIVTDLALIITQWGRACFYPHFTDDFPRLHDW